jgi:hypothetical protein
MSTPEVKVKKVVSQALKEMQAYVVKPVTGGFGNSGVPDLLVCVSGRFVGIECKAQGNKPTALQLHNLNAIELAGGISLVIDESNMHLVKQLIGDRLK